MGNWYEFEPEVEGASDRKRKKNPPSEETVKAFAERARKGLEGEVAWLDSDKGKKGRSSNNDAGFLRKVMVSGTLSDKMASMLLMVQESPMQRVSVLDTLLKMAARKGKREHIMALETLKDLFVSNLLPDRKLLFFHERERLSHPNVTDLHLVFWHFEDTIKRRFATFVECLEEASHDSLPHVKSKSVRMAYDLIRSKPERESALLFLIVNKLGDPDNKLASLTSHLLSKLLQQHPAMKTVVVTEVNQLLFRPNVSERAQHYGVVFLNQIVLAAKDAGLASQLVSCYLSLFKQQINVKRDLDNKTMTALLAGIHRALPFTVKGDEEIADGAKGGTALDEHVDEIFRMVYASTFNTAVQALQVLFSATNLTGGEPSSRFYRALYARLGSSELLASSKHTLFLNLLFKSLKVDSNMARVSAFIKRLLHVCSASSVSFCVGALILVSEVLRAVPKIARIVLDQTESESGDENGDENEEGDDDDDNQEKQKGAKKEQNEELSKEAAVGDDVIVFGLVNAAQYNGCQGVVKSKEGDRFLVHIEGLSTGLRVKPANLKRVPQGSGGYKSAQPAGYDAHKRDPEHAGAEGVRAWELDVLKQHYHPTVRLFAHKLSNGDRVEYAGDALQDFQPINFLDKFVYKKPKKRKEAARDGEGVGAEDEFFFRYFSQRDERRKGKSRGQHKRKALDAEEDAEIGEAFAGGALSDDDDDDDDVGGGSFGDDDEDGDDEEDDGFGGGLNMGGGSEDEDMEDDDEDGALNMGGGSGDDYEGEDDEEEEDEAEDDEDMDEAEDGDDVSSGGYSDMDVDDDDDDIDGPKKSRGDAEREMMREIEAGLASDDSDIEFNTKAWRGGGFGDDDDGEDDDDDGDDGEMGVGAAVQEEANQEGRGATKKRKKAVSSVFASADDYESLILKGLQDDEFEDKGDGKAKGSMFVRSPRGRGGAHAGKRGGGRGRGKGRGRGMM